MWISKKKLNEKLTHAYLEGYNEGYETGARHESYRHITCEEADYCYTDLKIVNELYKNLIKEGV